jgi:hypothetical protein
MRNARSAKAYCSVEDDADLFTPTLRILLNTLDPKIISSIDQKLPSAGLRDAGGYHDERRRFWREDKVDKKRFGC